MNEDEILAQLKKQTELLEEIQLALLHSAVVDKEKRVTFRAQIAEFNMSIGSMMRFMLKWLVAAIPVGIIIGIIYMLFAAIFLSFR